MVDPGAAAVVIGRRGWAVLLLRSQFHPVLLWPVLGRPGVIASSTPYAIRTPTYGPVRAVIGIDVIKFAVRERDRKIGSNFLSIKSQQILNNIERRVTQCGHLQLSVP